MLLWSICALCSLCSSSLLTCLILDASRCVIVSFDDGTLRILSLVKAAYDVPVTGKPFVGTQQQGFHSYYCSSFAIWSVQVSRLTGSFAIFRDVGIVSNFFNHRSCELLLHIKNFRWSLKRFYYLLISSSYCPSFCYIWFCFDLLEFVWVKSTICTVFTHFILW